MTGRWRQPLDDAERRPLFNGVKDNTMYHPSYAGRTTNTAPPSLRIGFHIACSPIAPPNPSTSEIRRAFLRVLENSAIAEIINAFSGQDHLAWTPWGSSGRDNHGAVFGRGDQETAAPTAWARILLPDPLRSSFWKSQQAADFILHIEPCARSGRPSTRSLSSWHGLFVQALSLADIIASSLLSTELALNTPAEPSTKAAVWLTAPRDLTELVDINGLHRLPGSHISSWFHGYAVADESAGYSKSVVATEWIRQMCDDALSLDGYESHLLIFGDG